MIRFTFTYLKPVALFLAILVLFQCCKVYDKKSVTIEEAINVDHKKVKRIKIDMLGGEKYILDSVYYIENELYGLVKKPNEDKVIPTWTETKYTNDSVPFTYTHSRIEWHKSEIKIDEDKIVKIRLHNIAKSRGYTAMLVIVPLLFSFGLIVHCFNKCFMDPDCKCP